MVDLIFKMQKKMIKNLLESFGRAVIFIWITGMFWTVYTNHSLDPFEYIWTLRIMTTGLFIWVFLPIYDLIKNFKEKRKWK